jgi:hypothetical protein
LTCVFQTAKLVLAQGMVMSDTPIRRDSPANLDRVSAAHQRRARIIAQLHEQAIAAANDFSAQHKAIRGGPAKDVVRGKRLSRPPGWSMRMIHSIERPVGSSI